MLRGRRQERREERGEQRRSGEAQRFRMREKIVSIGDDYWIEDDSGRRAYKVNGKALRLRRTLVLEDPSGRALLKIQQKVARVRDTMEIEDADGRRVATVKKALITPLRDRWSIGVEQGPDMEVKGKILDHEYTITRDGRRVAEVSKRWLRIADTYGVEIVPDEDPALVLAVTAVVDEMAHDD